MQDTLNLLNENYPQAENDENWKIDLSCFHLKNSYEIKTTIDRLLSRSTENISAKDVIADFSLKELFIRLMQTQARTLF